MKKIIKYILFAVLILSLLTTSVFSYSSLPSLSTYEIRDSNTRYTVTHYDNGTFVETWAIEPIGEKLMQRVLDSIFEN